MAFNLSQEVVGNLMLFGIIAGAFLIFMVIFFKKKRYIEIDKQKIVSDNIVKSNSINKYLGMGYVVRNNGFLFKITALGIYSDKATDKKFYVINGRPTLLSLPIVNILKPIHCIIVSENYCDLALTMFGKLPKAHVYLYDFCTLTKIDRVVFNWADSLAVTYYDRLDKKINEFILQSGKYAQYQRHTIVDLSEITKRRGEHEQMEVNKQGVQNLVGKAENSVK